MKNKKERTIKGKYSKEFMASIEAAREDVRQGRIYTHEEIKEFFKIK